MFGCLWYQRTALRRSDTYLQLQPTSKYELLIIDLTVSLLPVDVRYSYLSFLYSSSAHNLNSCFQSPNWPVLLQRQSENTFRSSEHSLLSIYIFLSAFCLFHIVFYYKHRYVVTKKSHIYASLFLLWHFNIVWDT